MQPRALSRSLLRSNSCFGALPLVQKLRKMPTGEDVRGGLMARVGKIGIAISGGPNPAEIVDLVVLAESLGYDSAWIAEGHGGDQFAILAACAMRTSRIRTCSRLHSMCLRSGINCFRLRAGKASSRRLRGHVEVAIISSQRRSLVLVHLVPIAGTPRSQHLSLSACWLG